MDAWKKSPRLTQRGTLVQMSTKLYSAGFLKHPESTVDGFVDYSFIILVRRQFLTDFNTLADFFVICIVHHLKENEKLSIFEVR